MDLLQDIVLKKGEEKVSMDPSEWMLKSPVGNSLKLLAVRFDFIRPLLYLKSNQKNIQNLPHFVLQVVVKKYNLNHMNLFFRISVSIRRLNHVYPLFVLSPCNIGTVSNFNRFYH